MNEDRLTIIGALSHKNLLTESLTRDAIDMIKRSQSPVPFIEKITKEAETEDCLHCDGKAFCRFLLACAYLELGAVENAKSHITKAIEGFRLRGMNWNEAICYWLQGEILLQEGNYDSAKRSWKIALEKFSTLLREFQLESNYKRAKESQDYINKIQTAIKNAYKPEGVEKPIALVNSSVSNSKLTVDPVDNEFHIAIPWIPVYKNIEVEAGLNGSIHIGQGIREKSELSTTFIDGKLYLIKPVHKGDTRVTLAADKNYGWVKVHGHSMNNAQPTAIEEGDYVLFYRSGWPDTNAVVIAAKADSSFIENGFSYIVKRYMKEEGQLKSETMLRGAQYELVTITEEYRCLGVVIAVAKQKI